MDVRERATAGAGATGERKESREQGVVLGVEGDGLRGGADGDGGRGA